MGQLIRGLAQRQASPDTDAVYRQVDWMYKLCDKNHRLLGAYR